MKIKNLRDLFEETIQDLYSAETQIISALPLMAKNASNAKLKNAFEMHITETMEQQNRLEEIAELLGIKPKGKTCKAMEGLIKETQELLKEDIDPEVLDAGLIAAAQKVEHYEIASYGTARVFAEHLGEAQIKALLEQTLEEEKNTDVKLTVIAESSVNKRAQG